jgi:hypothetical protein
LTTAILILAALNLVAMTGGGVLLYKQHQRDRSRDALLLAIERLTDEVKASKLRELGVGPSLVGKTVVVNTKKPDDQTFKGIVYAQYADRLTLRNAVAVTSLGEEPAPGLVHVPPVAELAFTQEIEA